VSDSEQITVSGLKELRKQLKAAGQSLDDLKSVGLEAAEVVAAEARQLVPRLSGALEQSIRAGAAKGGVVRAGSAAARYAGPIHFGVPARNIAPQPFLYDAADKRVGEVQELYLARVNQITDTVTGAG
jgi:hypothetical protein